MESRVEEVIYTRSRSGSQCGSGREGGWFALASAFDATTA